MIFSLIINYLQKNKSAIGRNFWNDFPITKKSQGSLFSLGFLLSRAVDVEGSGFG
jgi:hypothetical protein